jgi:LacI family transcriptional regulator
MIKKEKTIYDVAKIAKVSIATVSRALNGKYKSKRIERVNKVMNDLVFTPDISARRLGRKRTTTTENKNGD